jgi:methylglyoxal synthase
MMKAVYTETARRCVISCSREPLGEADLAVDTVPKMARDVMAEKIQMDVEKRIALVAHDHRKADLVQWVRENRASLVRHKLFATGGTGERLRRDIGLEIQSFMSGPLGGDQQIGSRIAEGEIDFLIFFWDPLEPQPHDPDVKALLRLAVLYNIPTASNRASADFLISSPLMDQPYQRQQVDYAERIGR